MADLSELLDCPICTDPFHNARFLKCAHTFCLSCMKRLPEKDHRAIICPSCRQETPIPHKGAEGLLKNFYVEKIRDVLGKLDNENQLLRKDKDVTEQRLDKERKKQGKSLETINLDYEKVIENLKTKAEHKDKKLKRYIVFLSVALVVCLVSHVGIVRNGVHDSYVLTCGVITDVPGHTTHLTLLLLHTLDAGLEYTTNCLITIFQVLAECLEIMTLNNAVHATETMLITIKQNVFLILENLPGALIFTLGRMFDFLHNIFKSDGSGTTESDPSETIDLAFEYLHLICDTALENIEVCVILLLIVVFPVYIVLICIKAFTFTPKCGLGPLKQKSRRGKNKPVFHTLEMYQPPWIQDVFSNAFEICTSITCFYKNFGKMVKSKS